tara:strand:- start:862 stop:1386 length:525 start_codon:yes stop_codon:yes gene_type:complete
VLKAKIRKKILQKRKKYYKDLSINYSFLKKILIKHNIEKSKIIGGYYPINFELDCLRILYRLKNDGFKISLPKIFNNKKMEFYLWKPDDPLIINNLGIPEPEKTYRVFPDVLLVPLVAYDKFNNRLGYGGGYYDRYLEKYDNKITTIGLGFSFQRVKKLKTDLFDKKLDLIITN